MKTNSSLLPASFSLEKLQCRLNTSPRGVNRDAGHFRDAANATGEAQFAKFFVFLRREAEANHAVSGFKRHERKSRGS